MLRRGNCKPEIVAWVRKHFKCETCQATAHPKARRPSAVPRTYRHNHIVGIDLISIRNEVTNLKEWWTNVVCWGTMFQSVWRVGDDGRKTPEEVWDAFVKSWLRIFGEPEVLVLDPGTEFQAYFSEMASARGMAVLPTDARSPWQNGRTERAGGEWKKQFQRARRKEAPLTDKEFEQLGIECVNVRNRYQNRSDFSLQCKEYSATVYGSLLHFCRTM
jgi:hypothetical protein